MLLPVWGQLDTEQDVQRLRDGDEARREQPSPDKGETLRRAKGDG